MVKSTDRASEGDILSGESGGWGRPKGVMDMTSDLRISQPPGPHRGAERSAPTYVVSSAALLSRRTAVQRATLAADAFSSRRNAAPVLCAEVLLHHGLRDDAILSHLARAWPLDEIDCRAALDAAHILLRREQPRNSPATDE